MPTFFSDMLEPTNRPPSLKETAKHIANLKWSDLDRIASHIAIETNEIANNGGEVNPWEVARILSHMAEDILSEAAKEAEPDLAAQTNPS